MATTTARARALSRPAAAVLGAEWLWLAALVVGAAAVRWAVVRGMPAPWIFVDEIVYSEIAKGLAKDGSRTLRDVPVGNEFGVVYPLVLAPSYALFDAMPDVYAAMKLTNALVSSLAAVPAYLLARGVVRPALAFAAAALTVATPALIYAGTLMTENAFYPAVTLAALALVRALERPTWIRAALLLAACALAFLVRTQAVALIPAVLLAPALLVAVETRRPRALAAYTPIYALVGGAALLAGVVYAAQDRSPREALGAYSVVAHTDYEAVEVGRWVLYHLAELDLAVGIAPLAALLLLVTQLPSLPRNARIFTVAAATLSASLLLQVAAFASLPHVLRIEERNLFHVMPLLFVALVVWLGAGAPRPLARTVAVAAVVALLPLVLPYERLFAIQALSDTFGLLPWWDLFESGVSYRGVALAAAAVAGTVAAVVVVAPLRVAALLPFAVFAYLVASHEAILERVEAASTGALFQGIGQAEPDWIDRVVGDRGEVLVLWSGNHGIDYRMVFENEFFNRSVGRVYDLGLPEPGGLPKESLAPDPNGFLRTASGALVVAPFVLTDRTVSLAGRTLARDPRPGAVLLRPDGPLRLAQTVAGIYPDGWSGPTVTYTRYRCAGGRLTATVESDGNLVPTPQSVRAVVSGGRSLRFRVPSGAARRLTVSLAARAATCTVTFHVSPTVVPAQAQPGATDERALGLRFLRFRFRP